MPLHRLTLTAALLASAFVNAFAADAITPTTKTELFNGKDTVGWAIYPEAGKDSWSIKDGILACVGKPSGFLRTEKSYKQYRFTVEWRFTKTGNTGVVVHMTPPDAVWPKSIECQGMHKNQGDFYFWNGATLTGGTELKDKKSGKIRGYRLGKQSRRREARRRMEHLHHGLRRQYGHDPRQRQGSEQGHRHESL
jgi:hypothetical protein